MIGLAASLLGAGKWLREAAGAAFRWVMDHPAQAALIAALLALWWQHGTLNGVRKDLVAMERARNAERAAHAATVANYREASKRAQEAAEAEKQRIENDHRRIAQHADQNYEALRAQYRAVLLRDQARTDSSSPGETGLPGGSGAAGVPEVGSSASELLISQSDALKCADLGAYAMGAFRWAEDVATSSTPAP